MSDLNLELTPALFFASSFAAALLGGWHCAGMCGPLASLANSPRAAFLYQIGRLISYLMWGTITALLGERILAWIPMQARIGVTLVLAGLSFWILISSWQLKLPNHILRLLWSVRNKVPFLSPSFTMGFLNGFLPCHWLYGFLLVSASLASLPRSLVLMFSLWLGSLLWLTAFSWLGARLKSSLGPNHWGYRVVLFAVVFGLLAHHIHLNH